MENLLLDIIVFRKIAKKNIKEGKYSIEKYRFYIIAKLHI